MTAGLLPWVAFLLSVPLLTVAYYVLVVIVGLRRFGHYVGYLYQSDHDTALLVPFYAMIAGVVLVHSPVPISLSVRPAYLLGLPLGFALYRLENDLWAKWSGKTVKRNTRDIKWTLPALLIPVAEEIIYRGGYRILQRYAGVTGFVLISAVCFSLVHGFEGRKELASKTVDGVIYAVSVIVTGSVVPAIALHLGFNLGYVHWASPPWTSLLNWWSDRQNSP